MDVFEERKTFINIANKKLDYISKLKMFMFIIYFYSTPSSFPY